MLRHHCHEKKKPHQNQENEPIEDIWHVAEFQGETLVDAAAGAHQTPPPQHTHNTHTHKKKFNFSLKQSAGQ